MSHQVEVTHITNWGGTLDIYLAECATCGWSGGRYFSKPERAAEQAEKHRAQHA